MTKMILGDRGVHNKSCVSISKMWINLEGMAISKNFTFMTWPYKNVKVFWGTAQENSSMATDHLFQNNPHGC